MEESGWSGLTARLAYVLRSLADLLVPRRCLVCGSSLETVPVGAPRYGLPEHLCPDCLEDLPETYFWSWEENPAEQQLWHRVGILRAASLYFYRQGSDYTRLVQEVKYAGNLRLGRALGRELGLRMRSRFLQPFVEELSGEAVPPVQALVPVPLHVLRRLRRGYNQAEVIARGLAEGLQDRPLPVVTDLLRRARYTRTQTRLDAEGKRRNVAGAFVLRPKAAARLQAQGIRHLLIVDDVMTTGATLSEAIRPLLPHFRVSVATIAFVE
ncbi:MAG: ComF family protein [Bacteroidales bacterium]|nr:ComF family protein [Bacteroidales bacterium]